MADKQHKHTRETAEQVFYAYIRMANEAKYRPAAPSDGLGTITVHEGDLDMAAECRSYLDAWWDEETAMEWALGCPDWGDRPALIFLVEAARCVNGGAPVVAKRLLRLAISELNKPEPFRTAKWVFQ